jgi:hypothetical protein
VTSISTTASPARHGELLAAGGGKLVTLDGTPDDGATVRTIAVPSIENDLVIKVEYTGHQGMALPLRSRSHESSARSRFAGAPILTK